MNTFEEKFGRSPTQEDFAIQAHTLRVIKDVLHDDIGVRAGITIEQTIRELEKK